MIRAQANLVSLGVAMLLVTAAVGVALAVSAGAFADADLESRDRAAAAGLAARLVDPGGPLAVRQNVLVRRAVAAVDAESLRAAVPAARGRAVRVTLDGRTLVDTGGAVDGATVRRLVLVETRANATLSPSLGPNGSVAVPPTPNATLYLDPPQDVTVTAVRVDGRVAYRDPDGLEGAFQLDVSRTRQSTLTVNATGPLPESRVSVTYRTTTVTTAVLAVSVDV